MNIGVYYDLDFTVLETLKRDAISDKPRLAPHTYDSLPREAGKSGVK